MTTKAKTLSPEVQKLQKAYQADQQVKYMSLQAELELLLQQVKTAKVK